MADGLHKIGLKWGVIEEHLDDLSVKGNGFVLKELIQSVKNCKLCMQGLECEEHKIKY